MLKYSDVAFLWARYALPLQILICMLVGACTSLPSESPPQLQHTPGPILVVEERTLQTSLYWVDPPAGWRIVKSTIASNPIVLVLVSPDESMLLMIGEEPVPGVPYDPAFVKRDAVVTLPNGQPVYMLGHGKRENAPQFRKAFFAVRRSIRLPE